jgi:protein phosphatase
MVIAIGAASDRGMVRPNNEDSFVVLIGRDVVGPDAVLVVADGLGGHRAGEVASHLVVDTFREWFGRGPAGEVTEPNLGTDGERDWGGVLRAAIGASNRAVRQAARRNPDFAGMGSTIVAAAVADDRLFVANVGDSRAYLISDTSIYQLSHDHSLAAEFDARGGRDLSRPPKNMLTRAIGAAEEVRADLGTFELASGDCLILCSDGLSNMIAPEELIDLSRRHPDPERVARRLVELANQRGGPDNITAVVARFRVSAG